MEQGSRFVPYFYKRKNYSTKNVELAMWVWVVWGKCGKVFMWGNCGKQ